MTPPLGASLALPITDELAQRTALVTGASGAIGRACALALGAAGARVIVAYSSDEFGAQETAAQLEKIGAQSVIVQADLALADAPGRLLEAAGDDGVDVLVNNAGLTRDALLVRARDEDLREVLEVNLLAAMRCSREVVRGMVRRRRGRIISISSVVGLLGNPGQTGYAASKAGLIGFTLSLAREVASRGITANVVAPGAVPSKLTDAMREEARTAMISAIPMGRFGMPEEIAAAVRFLAGDAAGYITGQVLAVDGGMSMGS